MSVRLQATPLLELFIGITQVVMTDYQVLIFFLLNLIFAERGLMVMLQARVLPFQFGNRLVLEVHLRTQLFFQAHQPRSGRFQFVYFLLFLTQQIFRILDLELTLLLFPALMLSKG